MINNGCKLPQRIGIQKSPSLCHQRNELSADIWKIWIFMYGNKITIKDCLRLLAAYVFSLVCADLLLAVQTVGYLAAWIQLHVRRTKKPGTAYNAVPGFYETRDEIISILLSTMIPNYLLSGVCHCQSRISSRS